ncbi:hypothetical protein ASG87_16135 [Frateuria sp. Soil773]|uniref:RcnB family protein n=1 Tax=Frateuria sp. Soil773 TaxID=1736407 RepID=UPI0006F8E707|nr:RcnB family protein [Frateuria sp. Soil773]KRE96523.1 hypothetical protein ASG87_16135 [Frateuria sp. Soil773]
MSLPLLRAGLAVALCALAGTAFAAPQDDGQWHGDPRGQYRHDDGKPDWQRRVEQHEREQRHRERDQEWQRRQQDELRRRADWQRDRDEAWQRRQEAIINRQAGYRVYDTGRYRHDHRWERGRRYDGPIVVVRDYDRYRLRQPPHGYRWVRGDEGDYLLVAIATSVILDIVSR